MNGDDAGLATVDRVGVDSVGVDGGGVDLTDAEQLRVVLADLGRDGRRSWASDPRAAELMRVCERKYAWLARRYGRTPHDAVVAAFLQLRNPATVTATNPWALVTTAVGSMLKADALAEERLCSERSARHRSETPVHAAQRWDETAWDLLGDSIAAPALEPQVLRCRVGDVEPDEVRAALDTAVSVLVAHGWPAGTAGLGIDYVAERLATLPDRRGAFAKLRRDSHALVLLDLAKPSWVALLTAVLGDPRRPEVSAAGRGLLLRCLLGESVEELAADPIIAAVLTGSSPAPATPGVRRG
ncbi:hypothetical protein ET495_08225 [Xylanimonas allomyrinae]|uniref:Uncharacterized protein n=1 Tax=Xylanimonas allomyrinae TaxID=2509459 RepID=A0A4P6EKR8_9MICO|nr:hypothetical protein [Xylanimonas allomyrinae]QAY63232.1 hypothetical protein ET495_08225 [Xylanimonas allomyrinae]